jgi:hypothetical protein
LSSHARCPARHRDEHGGVIEDVVGQDRHERTACNSSQDHIAVSLLDDVDDDMVLEQSMDFVGSDPACGHLRGSITTPLEGPAKLQPFARSLCHVKPLVTTWQPTTSATAVPTPVPDLWTNYDRGAGRCSERPLISCGLRQTGSADLRCFGGWCG